MGHEPEGMEDYMQTCMDDDTKDAKPWSCPAYPGGMDACPFDDNTKQRCAYDPEEGCLSGQHPSDFGFRCCVNCGTIITTKYERPEDNWCEGCKDTGKKFVEAMEG